MVVVTAAISHLVHRFVITALKTLLICLLVAAVVSAACYRTPDAAIIVIAVTAIAVNGSIIRTLPAAGVTPGLLDAIFYAFFIGLFGAFASAAIAVVIPVVILPVLIIIIVIATITVVLGAADVGKNAHAKNHRECQSQTLECSVDYFCIHKMQYLRRGYCEGRAPSSNLIMLSFSPTAEKTNTNWCASNLI